MTVCGMNPVAPEATGIKPAKRFSAETFSPAPRTDGEGAIFSDAGERRFLALFEAKDRAPDRRRHFGIVLKEDEEVARVREAAKARGLEPISPFACDFRDPFGNRTRVVDASMADEWRAR